MNNTFQLVETALNDLNKGAYKTSIAVDLYDEDVLETESLLNGLKVSVRRNTDHYNVSFRKLREDEAVYKEWDGDILYRIFYRNNGWVLNRYNKKAGSLQYGHNVNFAFTADYHIAEAIMSAMINDGRYPEYKKEVLEVS